MNTTKLRARAVEAEAWATLTAPRKPGQTGGLLPLTGRIIEAGAILGLTAAVTFLGLSAAGMLPYAAAHTKESAQLPAATSRAAAIPAGPAAMDVVPADVIDPSPVFFIGTGDGSAGSWTRP